MSGSGDGNIAKLFEERATAAPDRPAVLFPAADGTGWSELSFAAANRLSDDYARGLEALGVGDGDRVSLMVRPCLEFMSLAFAVFKIGALPILIDPGMGRKSFFACFERIKPRVLIGVPAAHLARRIFRKTFRSVEIGVTVGWPGWPLANTDLASLPTRSTPPYPTRSKAADDEAAILFTSGSTGPAKGVTYTHGVLNAQTRHIQEMYRIAPGEIDLACFPLFGLFSLAMGMTVVVPDFDPTKPAEADPARLIDMIRERGCTSAFGSPAIWKNVGRHATEKGLTLPTLRRILVAGAPVPVAMHETFAALLQPEAQIHTPYGATEALPVATIGTHEVLDETRYATERGEGICVGRLAPNIEIRIIRIDDQPIAAWSDDLEVELGKVGEICVRGPVVTKEYKELPEATALAKMVSGQTIWHRMGDLGRIDGAGRLWFYGRKAHRVTTKSGAVMFSVCCEAIFNRHDDVERSALIGVDGVPMIVIERTEAGRSRPENDLSTELLEFAASESFTKSIATVLFHDHFPTDVRHNAKINREKLAAWAAGQS